GAEAKGLPARVRSEYGMREQRKSARVGSHRPGNVENEHDSPPPPAPVTPGPLDGLASGPEGAPDRPAEVRASNPRRPATPRPACRNAHPDASYQGRELGQLLGSQPGE